MSSSAHFADPSSFQQQSNDFVSWLESCPGVQVNPKICLADLRSTGAGRGVVARSSILEGEELFSIPRNLILAVQNSELRNLLEPDLEALGPWLSLMLVMLFEYSKGTNSKWAAYFRVLPTRFDTLMFWSSEELRELQASAIVDKIGKKGADESILQSIVPVVRANPNLFPPVHGVPSYEGDAGAAALLELAHVMGSLIMAYAFDIEKPETEDDDVDDNDESYMTDDEDEQLPKGMVPLADLLNADADRNNARLFQEEECLVMKAIKHIQEGEEIFNDYGEIPRADLLRRYGYVIPRPAPNASLHDILPAELVVLLSTLCLTPEEFEQRRSKNKPPKPAMEGIQASLLRKILQAKQAQYGSSLAQDMQLLSSLLPPNAPAALEGSDRRKMMALQVRIGEKEVIQAVLAMLEPLLSNGSLKRGANGDADDRQFKSARV